MSVHVLLGEAYADEPYSVDEVGNGQLIGFCKVVPPPSDVNVGG